jgi:hypothetical protein
LKILISEAKIIIAFLFKRSGKKEMTKSEFYLSLSMDLKWFTPNKAKDFTLWSIKNNIILKNKDVLTPNFNIYDINIPIGFYPSNGVIYAQKDEINEENLNLIDKIVNRISERTGEKSRDILEKIKKIEKEKNILFEVATLYIGREYDMILEDYFEEVENKFYL